MEHPTRPVPPRTIEERLRAWIDWFGAGRLVAAAFATVIVCAGAHWLVRTPAPATEASLPRATPSTIAGDGTVAVTTTAVAAGVTAAPTTLIVHVAGAVVEPGVYELGPGSRVRDAVVAAGGPTVDADRDALNLAAMLVDATRVYVPAIGEEVPVTAAAVPGAADLSAGPVNVNEATAVELEALPGIGPATAAAIVDERTRNGPFLNVDDLDRVTGIGPAKLAALRGLVMT